MAQSGTKGRMLPNATKKEENPENNTSGLSKTLETAKLERAALLLAEDRLTDKEIADSLGISRRQLARWKTRPAFMNRVAIVAKVLAKVALKRAITEQDRRVSAHEREIRAIQERLDSEALQGAVEPSQWPFRLAKESPDAAARDAAFERYCYGEKREPTCLSFEPLHRHSTR